MKVAVVHDWLVTYAGAERVLEQILLLYPQADLFSLVDFLPTEQRAFLQGKTATTSFLQGLPFAEKHFRNYLALMPLAVERFNLQAYDLILSSSFAVAKGARTTPHQLHISYVHSPMRYAWDMQRDYLRDAGLEHGLKGWLVKKLLQRMRAWDAGTAHRVDSFVANSHFIKRRIKNAYNEEATVIFPPVATDDFVLHEPKEDSYLAVSRLVPYKKVRLIVETFSLLPDKPLTVIGDGPEWSEIKALADSHSHIQLLGHQPPSVVKSWMQRSKALVFAAQEDFGIVPVEAQACGTPVIAFGKGGVLETVIDGETGVFFDEQAITSLTEAIHRFEGMSFDANKLRQHAQKFSAEIFRTTFSNFVEQQLAAFRTPN